MKKVLFILPTTIGGGAERVSMNYASILSKDGFEIHIGLFNLENHHTLTINQAYQIHNLKQKKLITNIPSIIKLINHIEPEYIFSTFAHINFVLSLLKTLKFFPKNKLILREANMPKANIAFSGFKFLYKFGYKYLYHRCDSLIATSSLMRSNLLNINNKLQSKIVIIRNPVDKNYINQASAEKHNLFNSEKINLISIGRLTYQKGFDLLIDWFKTLNLELYHLTIIGDGPLLNTLTNQVQHLGLESHVSFISFQSNPYPWIKQADCLLLFSRWEGLPNIILESLACGTPVVASYLAGGIGEIHMLCNHNKIAIFKHSNDVAHLIDSVLKANSSDSKDLLPLEFQIDHIKLELKRVFN